MFLIPSWCYSWYRKPSKKKIVPPAKKLTQTLSDQTLDHKTKKNNITRDREQRKYEI